MSAAPDAPCTCLACQISRLMAESLVDQQSLDRLPVEVGTAVGRMFAAYFLVGGTGAADDALRLYLSASRDTVELTQQQAIDGNWSCIAARMDELKRGLPPSGPASTRH